MKEPITRNFLLSFGIKCGFLLLTAATFATVLIHFLLDYPLGDNYIKALSNLLRIKSELLHGVVITVLLQFTFAGLCLSATALFWTHKIAGPLYRLKFWLISISKNEFSPLQGLRRGDQLQNLPDIMNKIFGTLFLNAKLARKEINQSRLQVSELLRTAQDGEKLRKKEVLSLEKRLISLNEELKRVIGQAKN